MATEPGGWAAAIGEVAADQWGLVSRRQLDQLGVPGTTADRLTAAGGRLIRVAFGVYRVRGAPEPDHLDLRAAWLQLAPATPVWERTAGQGVVSHRSAAAVYSIGHLPADVHEFTVPDRRQTRRPDVRIHVRALGDGDVVTDRGLLLTRPARIAADLLNEREDPEAVAQIVADAIRAVFDYPGRFAVALAPCARRYGFGGGAGVDLLRWLLDLAGARDAASWVDEAEANANRAATTTERQSRR